MSAIVSPPVNEARTQATIAQSYEWPRQWPLLSAEWRHLAMLNYEIDPAALAPLVPHGTELDFEDGRTYISIVGFQFLRTRLLGVAVPWHVNFVEVNLRFYLRRRAAEGWRRGVAFVRELAPRRAVALVANVCYGEHYLTVPMWERIELGAARDGEPSASDVPRRVEYGWRHLGCEGRVAIEPAGPAATPAAGSHEDFIVDHYWGYSSPRRGPAREYAVAHPPWRTAAATGPLLECDVRSLYGDRFVEALSARPISAFWADGSAVRVFPGRRMEP